MIWDVSRCSARSEARNAFSVDFCVVISFPMTTAPGTSLPRLSRVDAEVGASGIRRPSSRYVFDLTGCSRLFLEKAPETAACRQREHPGEPRADKLALLRIPEVRASPCWCA